MNIPFNKPHLTGKEIDYINQAIKFEQLSGNGFFTKKCQTFFELRYGFKKTLLTSSCTDALEMCAILAEIKEGDEVIIPSFTFVSTAIAFIREGAKVVFGDSGHYNPNIDADKIESLVTSKTRAIVVVHYAGIACDMDKIMEVAHKYNLIVIEDAAQAVDSYHTSKLNGQKPLGAIGHLAAFSFHETKNIISGEGGLLAINDDRFIQRSEIIWEKGTNRAEFFRGQVDKYGWVDIGSSFLASEITAAFLWAQLEQVEQIQLKRLGIWNTYHDGLKKWAEDNDIKMPFIPNYSTNNAHMFFLICSSFSQRSRIIDFLESKKIMAVFHYQSLHKSSYFQKKYLPDYELDESDRYSDTLLRLPLYYDLTSCDTENIVDALLESLK